MDSVHSGYFILAKWITRLEITNAESDASMGPIGGLIGVGAHREITINREISPVDVGADIAQNRAKHSNLDREALLSDLLRQIEKRWEVSRA